MAGVCSRNSCRRCSSTSCACDDQGTWSEPSLLSQRLSEDSSRHQLLQKWTSMWNSLSGDASVTCAEQTQHKEAAEPAEEEDRPLVFLCSGCRRPLGDSLSWVTSQEDTNSILLRCVSSNVSVNKEQILSKRKNENGCVLQTLCCTGCSLRLGCVYRCTPENLDHKRDLFCLSVEAIESFAPFFETGQVQIKILKSANFLQFLHKRIIHYVLGSCEKRIVSGDKEVFNLESRIEIENSLKQMEDVLKALQTKLWEVESKLSFASSKS